MKVICFKVDGKPQPKARPRVTRFRTFTPESTKRYEAAVQKAWAEQSGEKFEGKVPLSVIINADFPIPESLSQKRKADMLGKPHVNRGDCDNVAKSILDALNGYAFEDDGQVCSLVVTKRYSFTPNVVVTISEVEE